MHIVVLYIVYYTIVHSIMIVYCNMTTTDKQKLFIIGKSKQSKCRRSVFLPTDGDIKRKTLKKTKT